MYDRRSRSYERVEGRFERRPRIAGEQLLAVASGERVLEIGSGPGESLAAFARDVSASGHVTGLDISAEMHKVAAAGLRRAGLAEQTALLVGDGAHVPVRTGSIDAAFACFTLELFDTPELPLVLDELRRVLRAGGRLVVVSLTVTRPPAPMERLYLLAHRLMPRLADCRPIPLASLLTEAGFDVVVERRRDIFTVPVAAVLARTRDSTQ